MAKSYANVGYGSQGDDVKELQTMLNSNGYALDVDGIYGSKTQSAVQDYQQKNNITEDGVGSATWGALTAPKTETSASSTEPAVKAPTKFEYTPYEKSDVVKQAEALLQQQLANKPGAYQSPWQDQLNDILGKILNREEFSYDINGDAFAKMYQDKYTTMGKMAMMDTMGQAQAMTGGYGNSYAQQVGQQAYQGYVQEYNDRIPELYQLALDQYNREGDAMRDQASILASMEEQDYGRYRDQQADYNAELDRLTEDARYQGELEYGKWQDAHDRAYNMFLQDQQTAEGKYNQLVSMITTLGYVPTDEELAAAGMSKEHYQSYKDYYTNSKKSSGGTGGVKQKTYKDITANSEMYGNLVKDIKGAENLAALEAVAEQYVGLGYDPEQINAMTSNKANEFIGGFVPTPQSPLIAAIPQNPYFQNVIDQLWKNEHTY